MLEKPKQMAATRVTHLQRILQLHPVLQTRSPQRILQLQRVLQTRRLQIILQLHPVLQTRRLQRILRLHPVPLLRKRLIHKSKSLQPSLSRLNKIWPSRPLSLHLPHQKMRQRPKTWPLLHLLLVPVPKHRDGLALQRIGFHQRPPRPQVY